MAVGIRIPSEQLYIVILSNNTSVENSHITLSIALHAARLTLTQPSNAAHTDMKKLAEFTGVYAIHNIDRNAPQMYQYVTAKNDTLFSQYPGDFNYNLLYVRKDVFISQYRNQYYHFLRNDKNKIVSVELYDEPVQSGPRQLNPKTALPLLKEKHEVVIDVKKLELLKGKYDFGGGIIMPITLEENKLYIKQPNQEKEEIFAENDTTFFSKRIDISFKFIKENDKVSGMIVIVGGLRYESKKIE